MGTSHVSRLGVESSLTHMAHVASKSARVGEGWTAVNFHQVMWRVYVEKDSDVKIPNPPSYVCTVWSWNFGWLYPTEPMVIWGCSTSFWIYFIRGFCDACYESSQKPHHPSMVISHMPQPKIETLKFSGSLSSGGHQSFQKKILSKRRPEGPHLLRKAVTLTTRGRALCPGTNRSGGSRIGELAERCWCFEVLVTYPNQFGFDNFFLPAFLL